MQKKNITWKKIYSHWSGKLKPKQILQQQLHTKNMLLLQLSSTTQILKENELKENITFVKFLHMSRGDTDVNAQKVLC